MLLLRLQLTSLILKLPHFLATMIAVHGILATFNPHEEDSSECTKRLTFYLVANGITTDAKKRAILLSSVGPTMLKLMQSLVLPASLDSIIYEDLMSKVKTTWNPLLPSLYDISSLILGIRSPVNRYWNISLLYAKHLNIVYTVILAARC